MTDGDQNLHVLTEHIRKLSDQQDVAKDKLIGANRAIGDTASRVSSSHGLVCWPTSVALSSADTSRSAAGSTLQRVSTELSDKLSTAASNYDSADYRSGGKINQAGYM